jgi:hypothetical protein
VVQRPCPGDIDGDGAVGPADFGAVSLAYGAAWNDPQYEVFADLDGDGRIDFTDFVTFAARYGQPCP